MNFFSTSRRDDMISLCYNLLFMLNKHSFPLYDVTKLNDLNDLNDTDLAEKF